MGYYLQTVTKDLNAYHFITAKEGRFTFFINTKNLLFYSN